MGERYLYSMIRRSLICIFCISIIYLSNAFNVVYANNHVNIIYDGEIHGYDNTNIEVYVEDQQVTYDGMFPVIIDSRTLVPLREVLENIEIGATVVWFDQDKKVVIEKESDVIELWIGRTTAIVNGEEAALDVAPKLISIENGDYAKTMVPIRFITESLGYDVEWNGEKQQIRLMENPLVATTDSVTEMTKEGALLTLTSLEERNHYEDFSSRADNSVTTLEDIQYNKYTDHYKILSQGPMSSIESFIWEDKLIIDIEKALIDTIEKEIDIFKNTYVKNVRSSQYSLEPITSRIVFDLKEGTLPSAITLNDERTELDIVFGADGLQSMEIGEGEIGSYITIEGSYGSINTFRISDPYRIIIDLENTLNPFGYNSIDNLDSELIKEIRVAQFNETTTRIVIESEVKLLYEITESDDLAYIALSEQEGDEQPLPILAEADYTEIATVSLKESSHLQEYEITYDYLNKQAIISFESSIDSLINIDNTKIYECDTKEKQLIITSDHIYEYIISFDGNIAEIRGTRPYNLYKYIVVIDPGHGGNSAPGATYNDVMEKDLNLLISNYFKEFMSDQGAIKYYFTRSVDKDITFDNRCELANDLNADFFISLHNNAMDVKQNPDLSSIRGLEVQITSGKEQSATENALAEVILEAAKEIEGMETRSIKIRNNLYVLKNTYMPSILIEYGYMTNSDDFAFLTKDENLERLALMTYECIESFLSSSR